MKVTVCIPTFNDAHVLWNAVSSALSQTVPPCEVIIVDDGSDAPVDILTSLKKVPTYAIPVRVVRVTNRGLPAARNTGLMLAKGEAIIFLDADDTIREDFIEKTAPLLTPDVDVVLVGLQEIGPTRNGRYDPGYDMPFNLVSEESLWRTNRFFYCALMRVSLMREVGGYNPLMAGAFNQGGGHEDHDLWIDLMRRGVKFAAVNEPLLNYSTSNPDSMVHRAERNREALAAEMRRHHRV